MSYKIKVVSQRLAVSAAVLFLYLKKSFELFCLPLAFSYRYFITNFILFFNFAQIMCLVD